MPALLGIRHPRRSRRPAVHGSARPGVPCPGRSGAARTGRPQADTRSSRSRRTQPTLAPGAVRRAGLPAQSVLAGRTSLAALTASARLVVSGDTGLAHLATAYARPSVVLFGPMPPAEWGPPQHPRHQVLWAGGDGYWGDPHGRRRDPALAAIPVSDVLRATGRALAAVPQSRPTLISAVPELFPCPDAPRRRQRPW